MTARAVIVVLVVSGCAREEDVGFVRLAISASEVDAARIDVTGPGMLPASLAFDAADDSFEGAVPAGPDRTFTFVGTHAGLPAYWGETATDVLANEITDVAIDAWPAGRMLVHVTLPTGVGAPAADVALGLVEGDPEAPDFRSARTDLDGVATIDAPGRREGDPTAFRWEVSAGLDDAGGLLTSAPLGFTVDLAQGAVVDVPVDLVDPAAPVRIVLVAGSLVGGAVPEAADVLVRVLDASGAPAEGYAGTISFDGSDLGLLSVPADYTFEPGVDAGEHVFAGGLLALVATGAATLAVRDIDQPALTDERIVDVLDAGATVGDAVSLVLAVEGGLVLGVASDVTVTALDAAGRVATGYRGTITFRQSDLLLLSVPPDQTFGADDLGILRIPGGILPLVPLGSALLRAEDVDDASLVDELDLPIG